MKKLLITFLLFISALTSLFAYTSDEVAGRWYMACKTPVGIKTGYIDCNFSNDADFSGTLNMFGHDNGYDDGHFEDRTFSFSGKIRFTILNIGYSAVGTILSPSRVVADIESNAGTFMAIACRSEEEVEAWLALDPFANW